MIDPFVLYYLAGGIAFVGWVHIAGGFDHTITRMAEVSRATGLDFDAAATLVMLVVFMLLFYPFLLAIKLFNFFERGRK